MANWFDDLAKVIAGNASRRQVLVRISMGVAALALGRVGLRPAWAARPIVGHPRTCAEFCRETSSPRERAACLHRCFACAQGPAGLCGSPASPACCGPDEYCQRPLGACAAPGACALRPSVCPDIYDPVCGCNGLTYPNACTAAAAGVSIDYFGTCETPACNENSDCPADRYCARAAGDCGGTGTCQPRPTACPDVYDPVCGCDGVTYGNACEAAAAGVSVAHAGACVATCDDNADCAADEFCSKAAGDCGGSGVCQPRPQVCTRVYNPVCGCDGTTYGNACEAAAAGVNIAHTGVCVAPSCDDNGDCGAAEYCARSAGDCGGSGVCQPRPASCPDVYDPVCGCDGLTYPNACTAAAAGINVAHAGTCATVCSDNTGCNANDYCAKAPGDCGGTGVCRPRPSVCSVVYDPVCGCDGRTYDNMCFAASAGVSVAHAGVCTTACTDNGACAANEYCAKPEGTCGGAGVCQPRPEHCVIIFDPVCGCDGVTYGNACMAAQAGVNVAHRGECAAR